MRHYFPFAAAIVFVGLLAGCGGSTDRQKQDVAGPENQPIDDAGEDATPAPAPITQQDALQEALAAKNPGFWGEVQIEKSGRDIVAVVVNDRSLVDISPLAGMPLTMLGLEQTGVKDLEPLRGMPLKTLGLNETDVEDLGPLEGMPLEMIYLPETKVSDLGPLAKVPTLRQLWLNRCPVTDISPLQGLPLVSLTLEDTKVEDLSPLAGMPLKRLHIGGSRVTDLSVLSTLRLDRLVFTPRRIKRGIDLARKVPKVGTSIEEAERAPAATFWARYDERMAKEKKPE